MSNVFDFDIEDEDNEYYFETNGHIHIKIDFLLRKYHTNNNLKVVLDEPKIKEVMSIKHTLIFGNDISSPVIQDDCEECKFKNTNTIHINFMGEYMYANVKMVTLDVYNQMMDTFVWGNKANVQNILYFGYTHKFYRKDMTRYINELYRLYELSCHIPIYPNPLLTFFVEGKLYYYILAKLNKEIKDDEKGINTTTNDILLPTMIIISQILNEEHRDRSMFSSTYSRRIEEYAKLIKEKNIGTGDYSKWYLKFGWSGNSDCSFSLSKPAIHGKIVKCLFSNIAIYQESMGIHEETKAYKFGDNLYPMYKPKADREPYINNVRIIDKDGSKLKTTVEVLSNQLHQIMESVFGKICMLRYDYFFNERGEVKLNEIEIYPGSLTYQNFGKLGKMKVIHPIIDSFFEPYESDAARPPNDLKTLEQFGPDMDSMTQLLTLLHQRFGLDINLAESKTPSDAEKLPILTANPELYFVTPGKLPLHLRPPVANNAGAKAGGGLFKRKKNTLKKSIRKTKSKRKRKRKSRKTKRR